MKSATSHAQGALALTRRAMLSAAIVFSAPPTALPARAALAGSGAEMADQYAAGARAGGGRGANTMLKTRADLGVQRIGGEPMFKPGQILDGVRAADGSAVDISFAYPPQWTVSKGPNLDVRDLRTSDSAFLLVAPLPRGKSSVEGLKPAFFTSLLFAPDGKYGAYGGVDDFKVKDVTTVSLKTPSGGSQARGTHHARAATAPRAYFARRPPQPYTRMSLSFSALTYNANTVDRRALLSATALGGSVYILVAGSLATRFKTAAADLQARRPCRA